jgi:hypothetical protein
MNYNQFQNHSSIPTYINPSQNQQYHQQPHIHNPQSRQQKQDKYNMSKLAKFERNKNKSGNEPRRIKNCL